MTQPTNLTFHDLLPTGYTALPSRHEDAESLAAASNAEFKLIGLDAETKPKIFTDDYDDPQRDFPHNMLTILDEHEEVVGGAMLYLDKGTEETGHIWYVLHPDARHKGIEDAIFAWYEQRMHHAVFPLVDPELKIALSVWGNMVNPYRLEHYKRLGFTEIRRFFRMRIDLDTEPSVVELPSGYRYVPYQHPEGIREISFVMAEAFRDHWGNVYVPLDQAVEDNLSWFKKEEAFDPSLFLSVQHEETGELVATCWVFLELSSEPDKALVADIGVLRDHRGKGIAEAMLTQSFHNFYQRGKKTIVLNVDTSNLTGALRLYTKVGMKPDREYPRMEKVLREGKDRATKEIITS